MVEFYGTVEGIVAGAGVLVAGGGVLAAGAGVLVAGIGALAEGGVASVPPLIEPGLDGSGLGEFGSDIPVLAGVLPFPFVAPLSPTLPAGTVAPWFSVPLCVPGCAVPEDAPDCAVPDPAPVVPALPAAPLPAWANNIVMVPSESVAIKSNFRIR